MPYTSNAKGIYLDDRHTQVSEDGLSPAVNFMIADAGRGDTPSRLFPTHVQTAYNLKVPVLARFESDPELYIECGFNPARWPSPDSDWQIKALDHSLKNASGVMRVVHGVMIDASKYIQRDGKTKLTSGWISAIAQHLMDMAWKRYRKPVYLFMLESTIKQYEAETSRTLSTWLSNQPSICVWLSAYLNSPSFQIIPKPAVLPVPPDAYNPASTLMYAPKWDFSRYALTKFGFQSICDDNGNHPAVPLFVSSKTVQGLYEELNYKPSVTPPPPPPPDPDPGEDTPPSNTDMAMIMNKLNIIDEHVTALEQDVAAIRQHFR